MPSSDISMKYNITYKCEPQEKASVKGSFKKYDSTLREMASYDFSGPVNAILIFEESDEEYEKNTSSTNVKVEIDDKTNNNRMESVVVASHKNLNEAPSLPIIGIEPIAESLNHSGVNGSKDFIDGFNDNKINKSIPNREQLKRKTQDQVSLLNKIPKQNEEYNITTEQYQPQPKSVQQTFPISKPNTTDEVSACFNTNQLNIELKQISAYVINLLDKVSEHLIHIIKAYYEHVHVETNNKHNPNVVEDSRKNFIRVKYHYFNLSYCTVLTIILPQNSNVMFSKQFLDNTIKTARKIGLNYQHQELEHFYNEMMHWSKGKKQYLDTLHSGYTNKNSNSVLKQHLTTPSPLPANKSNVEESLNKNIPKKSPPNLSSPNKTCIFSSGPPGKEISIQLIPNNQVYYNQPSSGYNIHPSSKRDFGEHCGHKSTYSRKSASNLAQPNEQPQADAAGKNYSIGISQINGVPERYHLQNTTGSNASGVCCSTSNQSHQATLWTNQSTAPEYYNDYQQRLGRSNQLQNQSGMQYQVDNTRLPIQMDNTRSSNQMDNTRLSNQVDNARSSVSRDSGFISPPNFNMSIDQAMNQDIEEERIPEQQVTPLITHVTSLNPKASYINYGMCQICGKTTKTKCLGCYKPYYCSHACQQYDWAAHMMECKGAQAHNARV